MFHQKRQQHHNKRQAIIIWNKRYFKNSKKSILVSAMILFIWVKILKEPKEIKMVAKKALINKEEERLINEFSACENSNKPVIIARSNLFLRKVENKVIKIL